MTSHNVLTNYYVLFLFLEHSQYVKYIFSILSNTLTVCTSISDCHYKISIYLFHCKSETVQMHHHSVSICFLLISGLVLSVCIGFGELLCVVGHSEWIFFHKTYSSLHFARFFLFSHLESISQQKGNEKNSEIPWYHMKQKNLSSYFIYTYLYVSWKF